MGLASIIIAFIPFVEGISRDLGFILLLITSSILGIKLLRLKYKFDLLDYLFLLFLLFSSLSTIYSWSISRSITELLRYLAYFIIFVSIRRIDSKYRNKFNNIFLWSVILPSIALSLISFFYLFPNPILPYPDGGMHLFMSTFGHNHLAGLLLFALPISIYRYIDTKKKRWGILTVFFILSLIFTYSRVAYIIVLFYFVIFTRKKAGLPKTKGTNLIIFSLVVVSAIYILGRIYSNIGIRLDFIPKQVFKPTAFENLRLEYLKQGWNGFRNSPIIGTGLDTFRYVSPKYASSQKNISWYAHNHFWELFIETGVIGGFLFLLLIVLALGRIIKSGWYDKSYFRLALFLGIAGSIVNNLIDYDWQLISLFLYFWITLGILLPNRIVREKKIITPKLFVFPVVILLFIVTLTFSFGKLFLILAKKNYPSSQTLQIFQIAGILLPWDTEQQQALAELVSVNNHLPNQYGLVRIYSDMAIRFDPLSTDILIFRGNFEDRLNDYLTARSYYIKAILVNPQGAVEAYRALSYTYISEAQKYFDEGNILKSKSILLTIKKLFPYMILIDIEKDYHSKRAIGEVIAYAARKTDSYRFWPPNINQTYRLIKNMIDKEGKTNVF